MTKSDYCFMMLAIFASPHMSNSWRVLLGILWFIAAVFNFIVEVR